MHITKIFRVFLLAIALSSFAAPAYSVTLLSSIGNSTGGTYGGGPDSADHFTTGTASLTVTSVNVDWGTANGGTTSVGIYTDNSGVPSTTMIGTLFTPPGVTVTGVMTYTGNAVLNPNTTYWMVVFIEDSSRVNYTRDTTFFADSSTGGASILEQSAWGDHPTGVWNDDSATLKYEIVGNAGVVAPTYTVGGTVSGLTGAGLALQNNGGDTLAVAADGPFTFVTELADSTAYAVTVSTQPTGQTCSVTGGGNNDGSGNIATADVINVAVDCVDDVVVVGQPPSGPATPVPTMSVWGLGILIALMGMIGFARRRQML